MMGFDPYPKAAYGVGLAWVAGGIILALALLLVFYRA